MTSAVRDLRGTWPRALASLAGAIVFILAIRWALVEPYVIPSESMLPTLLVHDHILVNKFAYGFRLPFTQSYLVRFGFPERGDVIVFRSVEDDQVFLIKRVVGLPGDEIKITGEGLSVNGQLVPRNEVSADEAKQIFADFTDENQREALSQFQVFRETLGSRLHPVLRDRFNQLGDSPTVKVPADHLFMSGDNRDHSADSRSWGVLPFDRVLGRASIIWLSCEEALAPSGQLCNPQTMRWHRLFTKVQ